jgi:site-specific recombinase XerD
MSTIHVTSINPNYRFGCHPATLKSHFQTTNDQFHDEKGQIPISKPVADTKAQPAIQQILIRVDSQQVIGKQSLMDFLYQKHLNNCKINTLANYYVSIIPFLSLAQTHGRSQLDQLTPADIEVFVEQEQNRGIKPATLRLRLMCIYCFLRYLVENDQLPSNRFVRKIRIKIPQTLPKAMPPNDVHRLLAVVNDIRNRAMILILLRTGMRIGELLNMKVYDLRLSEQKALIWQGEKNCVGRVVCLSADALQALSRWFDIRDPDQEYVFYSRRRHIMCYATARIMFKKYLDKAGLSVKNYGLHSLRHTFATDLLNAGMRLECLQQLLGHSSLEMTLRYARLTDQTREKQFFRAMARIEGGSSYEPDPLDYQLPSSSQAPELLHTHG